MTQTVVVIRDPQTHGAEWDRYTDYEVIVQSNDIAFSKSKSVVRRRYSEFAWLTAHLEEAVTACTGVLVPQLPPKKIFGRFEPTFIEERRAGLEKFLKALLDEPQFLSQRSVHLFLQSSLSTPEIERSLNDGSPLPPLGPDSTLSPTVIHCHHEPTGFNFEPAEFTNSAPAGVIVPRPERPQTNRSSGLLGSSY